ncbi:MAG: hypothetical protein AAF735_03200 [Myxococcota bacterium]
MRVLTLVVTLMGVAVEAQARSLDDGVELLEQKDYPNAALIFYDVAATDPDDNRRNEALVYLAKTLQTMKLWGPASFYYQVVLEDGPSNRRFVDALEQLLTIQERYRDHVFVADVIDRHFDGEAFARLQDRARIDQLNFILGEFYLRRGEIDDARRFLATVREQSEFYADATYLLGLIALREDGQQLAGQRFAAARTVASAKPMNDDTKRLQSLATLAGARAAYGLGRYSEAIALYREIPRYTHFWFQSLYEQAWVHYQEERYGEALGALESVLSPYFENRHVPEAYVIQGTAYFGYCQWDRVRGAVEDYRARFQPMMAELRSYLAGARSIETFFDDAIRGEAYAPELASEVRRVAWFADFVFALRHLDWQAQRIADTAAWRGSQFGTDIVQMVEDKRRNTRAFAGSWVKQRLEFHAGNLKNFQAQIDILDFEVTDAERQWLEQGREILKGRRARLPRPDIPNDQWQHWSTGSESWKDELGYYRHTLQSECN